MESKDPIAHLKKVILNEKLLKGEIEEIKFQLKKEISMKERKKHQK